MLLSNKDINIISTKINPSFEFFEEKEGYLYLKNISNHCVFFDISNKKCMIYNYRPQGCRFYPFIDDNGKCVIDKDCKNRNNIKFIDKNISRKVKRFIELLDKEYEERIS